MILARKWYSFREMVYTAGISFVYFEGRGLTRWTFAWRFALLVRKLVCFCILRNWSSMFHLRYYFLHTTAFYWLLWLLYCTSHLAFGSYHADDET